MHVLLFLMAAGAAVIDNAFNPDEKPPKLAVDSVFLYEPAGTWTYSHHPSLTYFKGRFYAMWSNGRADEDAPGQRVLYCSSADFVQWTPPEPLVGPLPGAHAEMVLTASGFHVHEGTLVAYAGRYEYAADHLQDGQRKREDAAHRNTGLMALTSTDGAHWSEPRDLRLPVVPNHPPQATQSGRLIISGNVAFPYTDNPNGLDGWQLAGIYPPEMAGALFDDSEGFRVVQKRAGWPVGLCEGSFYQTDDGVLHMLLRSGTPVLWTTESADNGAHWAPPQPTAFSDDAAKFHCGRLPDGRFYHVGNTDPRGSRNPLVLSLSRDGIRFDRHYVLADTPHEMKYPGLHKGGVYGYPHSMVRDGNLYVIVSICKESVLVMRAALDQLAEQ